MIIFDKDSSNPAKIITTESPEYIISLKNSWGKAIRESKLSVHQIAARIAEITGVEKTGTTLYNYSAPSHPHLPGIEIIPAFCAITKNYDVVKVLVNAINQIEEKIEGKKEAIQ